MRVTVTKMDVSVEGDAAELREAMPAILGHVEPSAVVIEAPHSEPALLEAPSPEPVQELQPAPATPDKPIWEQPLAHERVAAIEAEGEWKPEEGPTSPMPTEPYSSWDAIPADRLVWNSTRSTAHVMKTPNDPHDLFCPAELGMPRRGTPLTKDPAVCASCNKHIVKEARRDD